MTFQARIFGLEFWSVFQAGIFGLFFAGQISRPKFSRPEFQKKIPGKNFLELIDIKNCLDLISYIVRGHSYIT